MKLLMKAPARVEFSALKAGKEEGYDVDECMNDIYTHIWNPTIQGRKLKCYSNETAEFVYQTPGFDCRNPIE